MRIQYFDRQQHKMQIIDLPSHVDSVAIDIEKSGLVVDVNTDAVQLFQLGQRMAMWEYNTILVEVEYE